MRTRLVVGSSLGSLLGGPLLGSLLGMSAVAAAQPPAAASRELLADLADGSVPVAGLIDPAKGVWVIDTDKPHHACGAELLDVAVEVQIHAKTWGDDADCTNGAHDATCELRPLADRAGGESARFELRFDRTAAGLVLRTLVRAPGERGVPARPRGRACRDTTPVPTPPAPVIASERRDAPADGKPPTVATQAMLRHLARGEWALADLVDRDRGVASIDDPPDVQDDAGPPTTTRLCGAAIDGALPELQALMKRLVDLAAKDDGQLSCENRAGDAECRLVEMGEWGTVLRMHFRQTDRGLVLDAYGVFDENAVTLPGIERHDVELAQAVAHAWTSRCPK